MSDSFWTAFFTALPGTVAALAGFFVGLMNRKKFTKSTKEADDKLNHITKLTNGNLLEAKAEIKDLKLRLGHAKDELRAEQKKHQNKD